MKIIDVENFINSLDSKAQEEYRTDIIELKKRLWYRVTIKKEN